MIVLFVGNKLYAVGIKECVGCIACCHIVAGLHFIIVVQTERGVNQVGMMMGGVKRHLGIMKSVQSDKGGSTGQIAGVIAFANMWFLNLANLGKQKTHPLVGFLQFLLVLLIIIVGLGNAVVDIADRVKVVLVLHQFGIVLQRLNGRLCLFHVQINHTYLFIGHRTS